MHELRLAGLVIAVGFIGWCIFASMYNGDWR